MSAEGNLEIVRRALEAFAGGGVDAILEYARPDCVLYPDPGWIEEREYRGHEAILAFYKTQTDAFGEDFTFEIHEMRAVGERVLVLTELVGRAQGSGVPIRQQAGQVFSDFRDGMFGEDRTFLSWDAARREAGLVE